MITNEFCDELAEISKCFDRDSVTVGTDQIKHDESEKGMTISVPISIRSINDNTIITINLSVLVDFLIARAGPWTTSPGKELDAYDVDIRKFPQYQRVIDLVGSSFQIYRTCEFHPTCVDINIKFVYSEITGGLEFTTSVTEY